MKKRTLFILFAAFAAGLAIILLTGTMRLGRAAARPEAAPYPDQQTAARVAAWWLVLTHQNEDGGYTSFGAGSGIAPSDVGGTVDAILALTAAGYPAGVSFPGKAAAPLDYLRANPAAVAEYATVGGRAARLVQALVAANVDPYDFAGHNTVVSLTNQLSSTGAYADTPVGQALALQALAVVSERVPVTTTEWLTMQQDAGGSWGDGFVPSDSVDATAMALMGLVATGVPTDAPSVDGARQYLQSSQLPSGGWDSGFGESVNTTALVVQALSALGENFYDESSPWTKNGVTPLEAVLKWQAPSGAFQVDFGSGLSANFFATAQALPAVSGWPYPLPGRYEAARHAVACLDTLQDPVTGGWPQFAQPAPNPPNAAGTSRAIQAIVAFGEDVSGSRWATVTGTTPISALESLTPEYLSAGRGGRVGIVMQGVVAAGEPYSVTDFAGFNLPISLTDHLSGGLYADDTFGPFSHGEAMLGLLEAGYPVDPAAVQWSLDNYDEDWEPDSEGILVNVLGRLGLVPPEAIAHLAESQRGDAAWSPSWDPSANANATSEVVQGLVSAGYNPFDPSWSRVLDGRLVNAAHTIMAQQGPDGCWAPFGSSDPFATTDAILMLLQAPGWHVERVLLPVVAAN